MELVIGVLVILFVVLIIIISAVKVVNTGYNYVM